MKHEMHEIRSGGQTGADIAGLMAAKICGLPTGGWMPKGWTTLDGPKPQYAKLFNMQEHYAKAYPPRTFKNVSVTDGTIRFATNFNSAGERCTLRAIKDYGRPYFDVLPSDPPVIEAAAEWIRTNNIHKLNVAGNSKQSSPAVGLFTFDYLIKVFSYLGHPLLEESQELHKYIILRLSSPKEHPSSP